MVGVSRLLVALAVTGLLTHPLYADVIPTRRAAAGAIGFYVNKNWDK